MAVDLYVGPLTRYYAGEWENVGQRWAREHGVPYKVIRPGEEGEDEPAIVDTDTIRSAIYDWREVMAEGLSDHLHEPLEWDESLEAPYFTDRPHWDGYAGLLLLAAHEENPQFDLPEKVIPDWNNDPALMASRSNDFANSDYLHLLSSEMWLPCKFQFTFRFKELTGHQLFIGSAYRLRDELHQLNECTFKGTEEQRIQWRSEAPDSNSPFEQAARFGLAVFMDLAEQAIAHRLPIKLDY